MASTKSLPKAASRQYVEAPTDECADSPLGTIYQNSVYQNQRLNEIINLTDELLSYLGIGGVEDCAEKLAAAPYGRLEEIKESQNRVINNVNDLESKIFILRRALM